MPSDETERMLAHIGELLATDTEYPLDGTLLFAEVDGHCAPSIFKDRGNFILYRSDPDLDIICPPLYALQEAAGPDKRWVEIEYVIRDGRFEVTYNYPEDVDEEEDMLIHRDKVVRRHFGTKPIVYPEMPADMQPGYVRPVDTEGDDGAYYFF